MSKVQGFLEVKTMAILEQVSEAETMSQVQGVFAVETMSQVQCVLGLGQYSKYRVSGRLRKCP